MLSSGHESRSKAILEEFDLEGEPVRGTRFFFQTATALFQWSPR